MVNFTLKASLSVTLWHHLFVWACLLWCLSANAQLSDDQENKQQDPLALLNVKATTGAAAGYLPDEVCATCHADKAKSYQHVGMAQSFARPDQIKVIEDFGEEFFHQASQRFYQIRQDDKRLLFRRYQRTEDGKLINEIEVPIDWVMGSGNRARSYLYQTQAGELYMLPLGWYSQGRQWGMSPGFEAANHAGLNRQVKRRCMFCHNAFPQVPQGSDVSWAPPIFPKALPQGTGCQRCHGPAAEHVRSALSKNSDRDTIRSHIINPAKLTPEKRDSVCFQCHLLPSISFTGGTRLGRHDYSFRPGEHLSDYMVHIDIDDQTINSEDRFEINHHGYRLWQSQCFQKSAGKLGCISCHDPHVKPQPEAFKKDVAQVCQDCHQKPQTLHATNTVGLDDCVSCHMPERRTLDVPLVTMTDHRIARGPFDAKKLTAPIVKKDPIISRLEVLPFGNSLTPEQAELHRSMSVLRDLSSQDAEQVLQNYLHEKKSTSPRPPLLLLKSQLKNRAYVEAEKTATELIAHFPELSEGYSQLATAQLHQGKSKPAMASFEQALALQETPQLHYNIALAHLLNAKNDKALKHIDRSIELHPYFANAWYYKGRILQSKGQLAEAQAALVQALNIKPNYTQAYARLIPMLQATGKTQLANQYRELGLRISSSLQ